MHVPKCAKLRRSAIFAVAFAGCSAAAPTLEPPDPASTLAPDKGPGHTQTLPEPGNQDALLLGDDDTWRYVAPENPGRLYDAIYFDKRWFVLHGTVENSEKAVVAERNFLSWTRDGLDWHTTTLTAEPFASFTQLASNGESLLLAGSRHVGMLMDDKVVEIAALQQNSAPPVLLAFSHGYAIARTNDVVWLDNSGHHEVVFEHSLAQFRVGVAREPNARSLLIGPFGAFASRDGKRWDALPNGACADCTVVGLAYGNEQYLAADPERFFLSSDGARWQAHVFEPARRSARPSSDPLVEVGEDVIARVDFTAGHFFVLTRGGNMRISRDGSTWSEQLKIPLGQIGPTACFGRCLVAAGRLVRPPIVLERPKPPAGADHSSPYYCEYMAQDATCSGCYGATVSTCREGVTCRVSCDKAADCPAAKSGNARLECSQTQVGGLCTLICDKSQACPDGMECAAGTCLYVYDDPRCIATE